MRKIGFLMVALLAVALLVPAPAKRRSRSATFTMIVPWAAAVGRHAGAHAGEERQEVLGVNINVQNVTADGRDRMNQVARPRRTLYGWPHHVQPQHLPAPWSVRAVLSGFRPHRAAQP